MAKRKKNSKWIIMIAAVIVLLVALGFYKTLKTRNENYVNISDQHLNGYNYSSGGGMLGGYHSESVKRYEDRALISIESAEWHSQDPVITEYLTDASVLDELEAVVRKYKMNYWKDKEFTKEIVYDGETESYRFYFDEETIWFSSQIYPMKYREKLAELDRVVEKYIEAGEKLPGLVKQKTDVKEEEYLFPEGEVEIYVYSYAENALGLRILNGTDEDMEIPEAYKLINTDTDTVLLEKNTPYGGRFSAQSIDEMDIKLTERLAAGNYKLIFGDREIPFEIR